MENQLADALLEFYQKILQPRLDSIDAKLAEHDERFSDVLGHLDSVYHRIGRLEDEHLAMNHPLDRMEQRLGRMEESLQSGSATRADLEAQAAEMRERLADLQSRLEVVERQIAHIPD